MTPAAPARFPASAPAAPAWARPGAAASVRATAEKVAPAALGLPFLIVLAYIFVEYGRPQDWIGVIAKLRPGLLTLGAGMLALVGTRSFSIPKPGLYMIGFLCVMAAGIPFAVNNGQAYLATKDYAIFIFGAVFPIMMFVDSYRKAMIFFRVWVAIHISLAIFGIKNNGVGVGAFLTDENDFALVINMVLPYAVFLLPTTTSWKGKILLLGATAIFFFAVVASFSRGGFLGLVAAGVFIWLKSPRKAASLAGIVVLAGVMSFFVPQKYWNEMKTIETADNENDTGHKRLYYWGLGWRMYLDHFLIGAGPKGFQFESFKYESDTEIAKGHHVWGKASHSLYFTLLPEEGTLGVIMFMGVMLTSTNMRRKISKDFTELQKTRPEAVTQSLRTIFLLSRAADVSLVGFLVTGAFITVLYYPHFWLLAAFSVALSRAYEEQRRLVPEAAAPQPAPAPRWGAAVPKPRLA